MTRLLFGICARDPLTFALGGGTILIVSFSASSIAALPAREWTP